MGLQPRSVANCLTLVSCKFIKFEIVRTLNAFPRTLTHANVKYTRRSCPPFTLPHSFLIFKILKFSKNLQILNVQNVKTIFWRCCLQHCLRNSSFLWHSGQAEVVKVETFKTIKRPRDKAIDVFLALLLIYKTVSEKTHLTVATTDDGQKMKAFGVTNSDHRR